MTLPISQLWYKNESQIWQDHVDSYKDFFENKKTKMAIAERYFEKFKSDDLLKFKDKKDWIVDYIFPWINNSRNIGFFNSWVGQAGNAEFLNNNLETIVQDNSLSDIELFELASLKKGRKSGIRLPTASAILAALFPDRFPIISSPLVESLFRVRVIQFNDLNDRIGSYVEITQSIRQKAISLGDGITPRDIDKAIWISHKLHDKSAWK